MSAEPPAACPGCGLVVPGGAEGCRALYQDVTLRMLGDPAYGRMRRLAHDTYSVQHPDWYVGANRPKGLAAHLGGLAWAVAYGGHPNGYRALHSWIDRVRWEKVPMPAMPTQRGALTVADVHTAADPDAFAAAVERWAVSAWEAYWSLHPLIRRWIEEALAAR